MKPAHTEHFDTIWGSWSVRWSNISDIAPRRQSSAKVRTLWGDVEADHVKIMERRVNHLLGPRRSFHGFKKKTHRCDVCRKWTFGKPERLCSRCQVKTKRIKLLGMHGKSILEPNPGWDNTVRAYEDCI